MSELAKIQVRPAVNDENQDDGCRWLEWLHVPSNRCHCFFSSRTSS